MTATKPEIIVYIITHSGEWMLD